MKKQVDQLVSPDIKRGSIDDTVLAYQHAVHARLEANRIYIERGEKFSDTVLDVADLVRKSEDELQRDIPNPLGPITPFVVNLRRPLGETTPSGVPGEVTDSI